MSEQPTEQGSEQVNLGVSANTDVGGTVGTTGAATEGNRPTVDPANAGAVSPSTPGGNDPSTPDAGNSEAGKPLGADAPTLQQLEYQACPNCTVGVLYVTRYDPFALHEADQGTALRKGSESGGGYEVRCFNCDYTDSRAFNPGNLWGK